MTNLRSLLVEYLATLDNKTNYWREEQATDREAAKLEIEPFLDWLDKRQASEPTRECVSWCNEDCHLNGCQKARAAWERVNVR